LPWFQKHIPSIVDARERLLAPGGVLIPRRDVLWAALVETPAEYEKVVGPWRNRLFDVDLSAGLSRITNSWRKTRLAAEELLTEPVCWTALDYRELVSADVAAELSWRVERNATAHGVAIWFDAELADGIGFTNRPGAPELVYGQAFFPFPRAVEVSAGERVDVRLRADLVQEDYVWSWNTHFAEQKIGFEQSTFFSVPLSVERLRKSHGR
jgi:protein arginine N-methyltransferase 1